MGNEIIKQDKWNNGTYIEVHEKGTAFETITGYENNIPVGEYESIDDAIETLNM